MPQLNYTNKTQDYQKPFTRLYSALKSVYEILSTYNYPTSLGKIGSGTGNLS